jgi:peptidyl-dipeptidase A
MFKHALIVAFAVAISAAAQTPGATKPDTATKTTEKGDPTKADAPATKSMPTKTRRPTPAEAKKFVAEAEQRLNELGIRAGRAAWIQQNFITEDTQALAAETGDAFTAAVSEFAEKATRFDGLKLDYDTDRKLKLLKLASTVPAPRDEKLRKELSEVVVKMDSAYGAGKYCPEGEKDEQGNPKCYTLNDAEKVFRESNDPEALKKAWMGWHSVAPAYRKDYVRFVELANQGAHEQGYKDLGALWRSNYDMPPDKFAAEMERLWQQVKPLYDSLHTYVRAQLVKKYGPTAVNEQGLIRADLLGNMWSQTWSNTYPFTAPPTGERGYDVTQILREKKSDPRQMVRYGENFYKSLGYRELPKTFWERSLFTKPRDRDVVCHASAWDLDNKEDVRIKMCIEITEEDFNTIHHELGHNYYQMAYAHQPPLYQGSANDGFHEAIGDTIALSVTPDYLKELGFIQQVPPESADLGMLMQRALDKVAFLPFGYLVDQWRWKVFSGETRPEDYNKSWWQLRQQYQGIFPPAPRTEDHFDAGAKYHVAGNTPYARYFLAHILQFQFHRAMCRQAGYKGPLHRCSVYNNKEVGARLHKMLAMGISRPWPEALEALTGEKQMDATAIIDYFAPLKKWLDEQNKGQKVGWTTSTTQ